MKIFFFFFGSGVVGEAGGEDRCDADWPGRIIKNGRHWIGSEASIETWIGREKSQKSDEWCFCRDMEE